MSTATVVGCSVSTVGIGQSGLSVSEQIGSRLRQPRGALTRSPAVALAPAWSYSQGTDRPVRFPWSCSGPRCRHGDRPLATASAPRLPFRTSAGTSGFEDQSTPLFPSD